MEGWLVDLESEQAMVIFASAQGFNYVLSPDVRYVVVEGPCYGSNLGTGLYAVDIERMAVTTLTPHYRGRCEGTVDLEISPDGSHLIFGNGTLMDLEGHQVAELCGADEFADSFTWSSDGRIAYAACATDDKYDALRQFDIENGQLSTITDASYVPIRSISIAVSPERRFMAFEWGDSTMFNTQEYGVWLLDLEKLRMIP